MRETMLRPPGPEENPIVHRALQMRHLATEGPLSYRALALAGGVGATVTSAWSLRHVGRYSVASSALSVVTLAAGVAICVLESRLFRRRRPADDDDVVDATASSSSTTTTTTDGENEGRRRRRRVGRDRRDAVARRRGVAPRSLRDRGVLCLATGAAQIAQRRAVDAAAGVCLCAVGALGAVVGRSATRRSSALRECLEDERVLARRFEDADGDGDGLLGEDEFASFVRTGVGLELHVREFRTAFREIDADRNGHIAYPEFKRWWDARCVEGMERYADIDLRS